MGYDRIQLTCPHGVALIPQRIDGVSFFTHEDGTSCPLYNRCSTQNDQILVQVARVEKFRNNGKVKAALSCSESARMELYSLLSRAKGEVFLKALTRLVEIFDQFPASNGYYKELIEKFTPMMAENLLTLTGVDYKRFITKSGKKLPCIDLKVLNVQPTIDQFKQRMKDIQSKSQQSLR